MSHPIHLILSAGTRIVARNEINRIGGGQLIAVGAVAVILDSPADAQHAYKVRFNDGAEAMLRRNEFSILKEFKGIPGTDERRDASSLSPGERAGVRASGEQTSSDFHDWQPFVIYRCVVGSQAFGLSGDDSDVDRRGIYLPPAELHWSLYGVPEQIENNDTQEAYWELQKFLVMALKTNPNILECLHTPLVEHATPLAEELVAHRRVFLSKLIYQTYNGYVMSQFKKLEQDLRARGDIKWKHAMHLMRLLLSGISALREGELRVRLDEERDALLTIIHDIPALIYGVEQTVNFPSSIREYASKMNQDWGEFLFDLLAAVGERKIPRHLLRSDLRERVIDGVDVYCLGPDESVQNSFFDAYKKKLTNPETEVPDPNSISAILALKFGQNVVLLGADVLRKNWDSAAKRYRKLGLPKVRVLKVPHHGARNSFNLQKDAVTYLDICSHVPKAKAVLFAGDSKHPDRDVHSRLRDRAEVYCLSNGTRGPVTNANPLRLQIPNARAAHSAQICNPVISFELDADDNASVLSGICCESCGLASQK